MLLKNHKSLKFKDNYKKMVKNILFTGITGFIGRQVARELLNKKFGITAIIRPSTDPKRIEEFKENVDFVKIDLNEIDDLKSYLKENTFDIILHIGAVRGLKKISNNRFNQTNTVLENGNTSGSSDTSLSLYFDASQP